MRYIAVSKRGLFETNLRAREICPDMDYFTRHGETSLGKLASANQYRSGSWFHYIYYDHIPPSNEIYGYAASLLAPASDHEAAGRSLQIA